MIKKLFTIVIMLAMINIGTVLADAGYDLAGISAGIAKIESNKSRISSLENSLNGLKIDSRAVMWNFIGRTGNEKTIQKRSRILREIAAVKNENSGLASELLKSREAMYTGLKAGLADAAFCKAFEYLDGLAVAEALNLGFMTGPEIGSSSKSDEQLEFLRYKRDIQAQRLLGIETLVRQLKTARKAAEGAKLPDMARAYDKYLQELGNKQIEALGSQKALDNFLK
jgi:hypothetical protein